MTEETLEPVETETDPEERIRELTAENRRLRKRIKQMREAAIEKYLNEVLHLELNSKTTIGLVKHGITFVGCRIYPGYRKPTAQSVKKMKARMRYIAKEYEAGLIDFDAVDATMQSYFGLMGHCSTHGLQKWIEKNIIFKRKEMADIELPQEVTQWELNQF